MRGVRVSVSKSEGGREVDVCDGDRRGKAVIVMITIKITIYNNQHS